MIITKEYKGYKYQIQIEQDEWDNNPRKEEDNLGHMVCWHNHCTLGDEQPPCEPEEFFVYEHPESSRLEYLLDNYANAEGRVQKIVDKFVEANYVVLNLYLYDHSGITMSTTPFSCGWDSWQVGFIYCSLEKAVEKWLLPKGSGWDTVVAGRTLREVITSRLEGEVKTYDDYLTGNVYRYSVDILDEDDTITEECIDSCCGFFGYDHEKSGLMEYADGAAQCRIDGIIKDELKAHAYHAYHAEKVKAWIRHRVPLSKRYQLEVSS